MGLKLFSINHRDHDLFAVEQLTPLIHDEVERDIIKLDGVNGVVVLSTCNRIEILLDVAEDAAANHVRKMLAAPRSSRNVREVRDAQATSGGGLEGDAMPSTALVNPREFSGIEVVKHLSLLACGLESMVVGEREITGQLRHSAKRAERRDTLSAPIVAALDTAFRAARQVERETGLSGMGRSIAAIALNHAEQFIGDYRDVTVTLFGTGSYAGAAVTQLKERGCRNIYVHSASGRAESFANGRGLRVARNEDLGRILAKTDMIVSARGTGSPTVTLDHVRAGMVERVGDPSLVVLDLAIVRDVEPAVAQIPGVTLIDLDTVRSLVPKLEPMKTTRARHIVAQMVKEHEAHEAARVIDPVIVQMRGLVSGYIAQEMANLPQRDLDRADVERALRRLTNRLLHHPTAAAHAAGANGLTNEFIDALEMVTGISFDSEEEETA